MDFTPITYKKLLNTLIQQGYRFLTVEQYTQQRDCLDYAKVVMLRHDIDDKAYNALFFAQIEATMGVRATYYFRIVKQSNEPSIIKKIVQLGHEIGFHYECLSQTKGNLPQAYTLFQEQLAYFRQFYPIQTICMHGAPTSTYDGRDLWKHYDYRKDGIIAEPYLDFDYSQLFYLTDTGRCWDGYKVSVRDKIPIFQEQWSKEGLVFHTTKELINAITQNQFKKHPRLLITTHPQRWNSNIVAWIKEFILQKSKNIVKRILIIAKY